jgi:lipoyl-dependent peroxiredoxin subunit D
MKFVDELKAGIPDWAKDLRLNCDAVLLRSTLAPEQAVAVALAAAYSVGNNTLAAAICNEGVLSPVEQTGCLTAASLMAMNNVWYPFMEMSGDKDLQSMPAQLRMNA